ncbi:MAG: 50S ribosomal protein L2 [Puniceicoccales bacterium]|jgi:large subunit ribosomal protein L2|nr:50S ribosomal protein L2 [Puniceicoccales bacterium]
MTIVKLKPLTPGQRFLVRAGAPVAKSNSPCKKLTRSKLRISGRNCYGRITMRRRGGGHKRLLRLVDFRRDKIDIPASVERIEYDPNRSANIALLKYADGEKRYILATETMASGDKVISSNKAQSEYGNGMALPLHLIPQGLKVHCIEFEPGRGAQLVRAAGEAAQLMAVDGDRATLKMPSGEMRYVHSRCRATIGEVGNSERGKRSLGKAGRNRWCGRRPRVRGVAMNPIDHPNGGGHGRTSGGGHPVSPWGQLSKGKMTRRKSKPSNSAIITRRNGRKVKKG